MGHLQVSSKTFVPRKTDYLIRGLGESGLVLRTHVTKEAFDERLTDFTTPPQILDSGMALARSRTETKGRKLLGSKTMETGERQRGAEAYCQTPVF